MVASKVQELKERGNECIKEGKYPEAIIHYTHAIKLDPCQYQLYSNRSLAFLKIHQYYYAREDAKECIKLNRDWAKAHFRKGEVEFECGYYDEALDSYRQAFQLQGDDKSILEAIRKAKREQFNLQKANVQIPWVGAGFGFVFGVLLVVADHVFQTAPLLANPLFKLLIILVCSATLFTGCRIYRHFATQSKRSLLDPPLDLLGDDDKKSESDTDEESIEEDSVEAEPANDTTHKRNKKSS